MLCLLLTFIQSETFAWTYPANIYMFKAILEALEKGVKYVKVKNEDTTTTSLQRFLVFLLLTLNR